MSAIGNIVDGGARAIGSFVGRILTEADKSRQKLAHHPAAEKNRTNRDWRANLASADQVILNDLDTLIARSRLMDRSDGYAGSARGAYRRYVVGGGITARSAARHPDTGKLLTGFNKQIDRLWNEWWNSPEFCDAERTKTMAEKQWIWMNELFVAGGLFIIEGYKPQKDTVGLVLQEVEYEQADTMKIEYEGRPVRRGIEIDEFGGPVAYHLHTVAHPLEEYSTKSGRIEAERVIHMFRQDRVRQKCGAPWMTSVLPKVRNLAMYEQYSTMKARTEAAYNGFVEQEAGGAPVGLPAHVAARIGAPKKTDDSTTSSDEIEVRIEQGLFPILKPGQKIKFPTPSNPNSEYSAFIAEQLKGIAAGTGLDLSTVARWYADGNFSSQRQAKLDIWAETDPIQQILFISKTLKRIRRRFIEIGIREGRIIAPGYHEKPKWRDAYLTCNWKGPPKPSIDKAKDAAAAKLLMALGLMSPQDYANEKGLEIADTYAEIAEAREMRQTLKIDDLIDQVFGNGKIEPREPRPEKKQPGEDGDNGNGDGLSQKLADRLNLNATLTPGAGD